MNYMKIYHQFWTGKTGEAIKKFGPDTQLVAIYLFSNPHATAIGIYYLPERFIVRETGIPIERVQKALQNLCQIRFCTIDAGFVWVHKMGLYQVIKPNDTLPLYGSLGEVQFLKDFYHKHKISWEK